MSKLSLERWHQVDALLDQVLELPPDEQQAFLQQACGDDTELLSEVQALLLSEKEAAHILGESVSQYAAPLLPELEDELQDPEQNGQPAQDHIGPYRVVQELGRGGMGVVYLAQRDDEHFHHTVAIKVIQRGLTSQALLSRFHYEREILATLDHPNIARLFDGGTTDDGRPYFVMEYVEGRSVTDYCDEHRLSTRQRLALFRTVCRAVQYAHQNLIVHRDLKPSNILVTDDGQVKLLDFGIAKLLSEEATEEGVPQTQTGQRLMTPEYAAPEQIRGEVITTATDVYQLGVLLYELLTGRRPFRMESRVRYEIERVILEEEPTRPSTAIGQTEEAEGDTTVMLDAVVRARSTSVEALERRLRGDLDVIVMKALRKEQDRRYGSAEQLSEDLRRHLVGLPVAARSDTMGYRLAKFVQRHKVGVVMAAAFVLVLAGSSVMLALQGAQTARERDRATLERDKAQEVATFLEHLFDASDPFSEERLDTMQVRTLLQRGAAQVQDSLGDQPLVLAQMLTVIGRVYGRLGLDEEATPLLQEAVDTRRNLLGSAHADVAASLMELGDVLYDRGQYAGADSAFQEALTIRQTLYGKTHPSVAVAMRNHGLALHALGKHTEAEELFREALAIQQAVFGDQHMEVAKTLSMLASVLEDVGSFEESEAHHQDSLEMRRTLYSPGHPSIATGLSNLAVFFRNRREYSKAEPFLRETIAINRATLDAEHPNVINDLNTLATVLRLKGDYEASDSTFQEVLALRRKRLGNDHPDVSITLDSYAVLLKAKGDYEGAERLQREAIAIARKNFGDEHMAIAITTGKLASILKARGEPAQALPVYRESLALQERLLPPDHPNTAVLRSNMGGCLIDLEQYEEAEALFLVSLRTLMDTRGQEDRLTQSTIRYLVTLYDAWDKPDELAKYQAMLPKTTP